MGEQIHISPQLLDELSKEDLDLAIDLLCRLAGHLAEECSVCRIGAEAAGILDSALRHLPDEEAERPQPDYEPLVARTVAAARRLLRDLGYPRRASTDPKAVVDRLRRFLELGRSARWLAAVEDSALWNPEFAEAMLQYTRDEAIPAGGQSEDLARLAICVVERIDPSDVPGPLLRDLLAQAWALLAREFMALSAQGAAHHSLQTAELLLSEGTGDPLAAIRVLEARVFWIWRWSNPAAALRELGQMKDLARQAASPRHEGECQLWESLVLGALARPAEARRAFEAGMMLLGHVGEDVYRRVLALQDRLNL